MKWTRIKPGLYRAGDYQVGLMTSGEWFAEGPNVDAAYRSKGDAQMACVWAMEN